MSATSATVRVEKATSDLLIGPDWTMNMDICDSINTDHWQAKDVIKAVKKRLQHKNPRVQFLALTLLETMVKNCGDFVHFQVTDRGILQEMIKIVRKKTDMQVRNKILVLLDSWQEAFGGPGGKYPQYYWAYTELKGSGVVFPKRSPDSALIFTPPGTHPATAPIFPQIGYGMPSNSSLRLDEAMASEMANLSLSDLDSFRSVMELLSDMLKAVDPSDREAVKDEVIVDLASQCRSNQKKLLQLVNSTGDEELLGQGLALNDDLQNLLAKHDAIASGSPLPTESSESIPGPKTPTAIASSSHLPTESSESSPGPKTPIARMPPATTGYEEDEEEQDDDFAQLARRNSKYMQAAQANVETSGQVASSSHSDETNATTGSTSEVSSSVGSNALALPDPPAPVRTSSKEQDMIDLLSITLATNSPPRTPLTPPSASFQSKSPASGSPHGAGSPYAPPQPYMVNQSYAPYNGYVAPWAQAPQPPQVPHIPSGYVPPPWEATSSASPNPFTTSTSQFPASTVNTSAAYPLTNQFHASAVISSAVYPPANQFPASAVNASATYAPAYATQPQQQYDSFGSRVKNIPASTAATQANANLRQTGHGASPQPYVLPNKLFEDLIDLRSAERSAKPGNTALPSHGMIGGRK